jgi:beta-mannosidase
VHDAEIQVSLVEDGGAWFADLATDKLAQSVHFSVDGFRPDDDWFHLAPGAAKRVLLRPLSGRGADDRPTGEVLTPGGVRSFSF